jgi:putative hydrolase of the HAD superfamily
MDLHKNLIFDADDTLWENNIYFIEATEAFLDLMEQYRLDREAVRQQLSETERRTIVERGYGSDGFTHSLLETAHALLPDLDTDTLKRIEALGRAILERDTLDLRPGAEEALQRLREHNRLFLLTKGNDEEQRLKLERSRLAPYFEHVEVASEKNAAVYRKLVERLGLDPARTWMIGNSPRSDINPALEAGLNAVFIPHPRTWELEVEEIIATPDGRLTILESLSDLITLFTPSDAIQVKKEESTLQA